MTVEIHPTATVDPRAELAPGVLVGPHAVIGPQVEIGADTEVGAGAQVRGPSRIGAGNRIFPHACVGFEPQDLKYQGEETRLEVGDRNVFRELCTVNRGTAKGGGVTRIGDDNLFMAYAHVAHDCLVGNRTIFANGATLAGHVEVQDDASISAFTSIHQFCRVGRHAYVGGYSVITQDALPFVKTVGIKPACYGINRIGLERKGMSGETIRRLDAALRVLLRGKRNVAESLEVLRREHAGVPELDYLIDFVATAQRGVIRTLPGRKGGRGGS
ncbi:MAG TPA: acyl-ACP--UDP-N-acetylglucosamine O-acyltransferase [Thermoanaerobaculia bacterium]|nr:acyl-ACP--UDP-N-acetylglucosamine O-acyltransferase [Thermoanaerobaculia bacterium]